MTLKIAVLVSGTGRTFRNIVEQKNQGDLDLEVLALISTKQSSPALQLAQDNGIANEFVSWKTLGAEGAAARVFELCENADLIVMAGFFKFLPIPESWAGRVINIHPSLLPRHGGQGCYGDRVHAAVLSAGDVETGCTVHAVDNEYDHGKILEQISVPVNETDTVETLASRVFEQELILYPRVLNRFIQREWALPLSS